MSRAKTKFERSMPLLMLLAFISGAAACALFDSVPEAKQTATLAEAVTEEPDQRVNVIFPGDAVQVLLLTGVNAPTDGSPYPAVFKLNGKIEGPDGTSLDVGEARLYATAQGSEADSRALYRLTQLSLRHPDGHRTAVKVDGWIVGEDGIRGMSGRLVDKLLKVLETAAAAQGLEPFDFNPDGKVEPAPSTESAEAGAAAPAPVQFHDTLVPVVEVLSGREGTAIFSTSTEIDLPKEGQTDDADLGGV